MAKVSKTRVEIRVATTCEMCGQKKKLRNVRGKMACPTCEHIRRSAFNSPELTVAALEEFHGGEFFPSPGGGVENHSTLTAIAELLGSVKGMPFKNLITTVETVRDAHRDAMAQLEERFEDPPILPLPGPGDFVQSLLCDDPQYDSLSVVLGKAMLQASEGKGKERHARPGVPFEKQKICENARRVGLGSPLGQAIKKTEESLRLGDRGPAELLGAINYLAAAYIVMEEELRLEQAA